MEELLKYIEEEIERVRKIKLYTMDEDGEEIECYDGECIYHDGRVEGMYQALIDTKRKILELIK